MQTTYKVGDKVRITKKFYEHNVGDVKVIDRIDLRDKLLTYGFENMGGWANPSVMELISPKQTKNQRISALEKEVEALKAEMAALKAAQKAPITTIANAILPPPNEQRKAIIAEAKAFVADILTEVDQQSGWRTTTIPLYKKKGRLHVTLQDNQKKRTVVALAYYGNLYPQDKEVVGKAIAKCNPSDVFNADIGKAIALGRALGLDVERFEKAVQPSEVVVGQSFKVTQPGAITGKTVKITKLRPDIGGAMYGKAFNHTHDNGWLGEEQGVITDDTEAQY